MRLAISISPSRVSSSTEPISRMYMRTGSVVRPNSESTRGQRGFGLFLDVLVGRPRGAASDISSVSASGRLVVDLDAHVADHA